MNAPYLEIGMSNVDISSQETPQTSPSLQINETSNVRLCCYFYLESGIKKQNVLKKVIEASAIYKCHSVQ